MKLLFFSTVLLLTCSALGDGGSTVSDPLTGSTECRSSAEMDRSVMHQATTTSGHRGNDADEKRELPPIEQFPQFPKGAFDLPKSSLPSEIAPMPFIGESRHSSQR
jgi:hypothetical protein